MRVSSVGLEKLASKTDKNPLQHALRFFKTCHSPTAATHTNAEHNQVARHTWLFVAVYNSSAVVFERTLVTEVIGAEEEEEIASRQEDGGSTHSLRKSGVAMVYVNNQLVLRNATLREGDKLRIGQTHVFQLNVPQTKEEVASKEPVDTITSPM